MIPITLNGLYYDGRQPLGVDSILTISGTDVTLQSAEVTHQYRLANLNVSPRIAQADRFIDLPDGGQFQCPDSAALDPLPQERSEGLIAWLETRVLIAVLGIAVVIVVLLSGYFYGLPKAAEYFANRIPIETERLIGKQGLEWLDENKWLVPSAVNEDVQAIIRQDFDTLRQGLVQEEHYRLEFRSAPVLGANAFAFPGGTIVITDGLINLAKSREEVAAVLAHEIGHIELRHTLRLIIQDSMVAVVAATIIGDVATLGAAGVPAILAQAKYSREFEAQSDDFAFVLLKKHGISPENFAKIMLRMAELGQKNKGGEPLGFLSTHPYTQDRVERAREAARSEP